MSVPYLKNIPHESILELGGLVEIQPGQIVSKTLAQNPAVSMTLFAFDKGEGTGQLTVDGKPYVLRQGQTLVMPAGKPHAVFARESFKMSLLVIFPHAGAEETLPSAGD